MCDYNTLKLKDYNLWKYTAKGSANAVYRYNGPHNPLFTHKVIRVRLTSCELLTKEVFEFMNSSKLEKLREYIPRTDILSVDRQFMDNLQRQSPASVKLNRLETDVLLLDDIFTHKISAYHEICLSKYYKFYIFKKEDQKEFILEFKPKWLYKPPAFFKTCRNCAQSILKKQKFSNCTLLLLSMPEGVRIWCRNLQNELERQGYNIAVYDSLFQVISEHYDLIEILYKLENKNCNDMHNALRQLSSPKGVTDVIRNSMSLRDVSITINLSSHEVHVLDIDPKPTSKWKKWKEQEIKNSPLYLCESNCSLNSEDDTVNVATNPHCPVKF